LASKTRLVRLVVVVFPVAMLATLRRVPPLLAGNATRWTTGAAVAKRRASTQRSAIFMAGIPGSGKTRIIDALYGLDSPETVVLDLDEVMRTHPDFDPAHASQIYEVAEAYNWADAIIEQRFRQSLADGAKTYVVLDGTGTKVERRLRRIRSARDHGMRTVLLYVKVSLETALRRNARRKRIVPPHRLKEYLVRIDDALRAEEPHVDCFDVLDNNRDFHNRIDHIHYVRSSVTSIFKPCVSDAVPPSLDQRAATSSSSGLSVNVNPHPRHRFEAATSSFATLATTLGGGADDSEDDDAAARS